MRKSRRTEWTVMLVPGGAGRVLTLRVSAGRVAALVGCLVLVLLVSAGWGGATVARHLLAHRANVAQRADLAERDARIRELEEDRDQLAARLAARPSIMPSSGYLSSLFGNRHHPVLGVTRAHRGVDIAAAHGRPILAPAEGVVRFAGDKPGGYGYTVEIDHGYGYLTRFAHASRLTVSRGDRVHRGQLIALVGATGRTTGPHLHYEVEVHGQRVDPVPFMVSQVKER